MAFKRKLVIVVAVAVSVAVLFIAVRAFLVLKSMRVNLDTVSHLKIMGLFLNNYENTHHRFPPPFLTKGPGKPRYSWRVALLPYLGEQEQELYDRYHFDEPWDGPNNRKLIARIPREYQCPFAPAGDTTAHLLMVTGDGTAGQLPDGVTKFQVKDGTSHTAVLLLVENSDIQWLEPRDISLEEAVAALKGEGKYRIKFLPSRFFPSGCTYFLTLAGFVEQVGRESLTPERLRGLFTIDGNEDVSWSWKEWQGL